MAESTPLEDPDTGEKSSQCRYFKMKVLGSHRSEGIDATVEGNFDETSIVFSDRSTSYVNISDYLEMHIMEKSGKETTATTLKWVHIAIAKKEANVNLMYLCDVMEKQRERALRNFSEHIDYKPKLENDIRKVIDDPKVDVLINTTPDH